MVAQTTQWQQERFYFGEIGTAVIDRNKCQSHTVFVKYCIPTYVMI